MSSMLENNKSIFSNKIDETSHLVEENKKTITDLININNQIKLLEQKKEMLLADVKTLMKTNNVSEITFNGTKLALSSTERKTVQKKDKDKFVSELIDLNKKHLLLHTITVDVDSVLAEVDAGIISKDIVKKYIKITPVDTLRILSAST